MVDELLENFDCNKFLEMYLDKGHTLNNHVDFICARVTSGIYVRSTLSGRCAKYNLERVFRLLKCCQNNFPDKCQRGMLGCFRGAGMAISAVLNSIRRLEFDFLIGSLNVLYSRLLVSNVFNNNINLLELRVLWCTNVGKFLARRVFKVSDRLQIAVCCEVNIKSTTPQRAVLDKTIQVPPLPPPLTDFMRPIPREYPMIMFSDHTTSLTHLKPTVRPTSGKDTGVGRIPREYPMIMFSDHTTSFDSFKPTVRPTSGNEIKRPGVFTVFTRLVLADRTCIQLKLARVKGLSKLAQLTIYFFLMANRSVDFREK
ncbi:hypothetical protein J6590_058882 [Homalodisca vitripennis]|nr:hypothetical protein J6590_058882 [Homalodisca vitripennis]